MPAPIQQLNIYTTARKLEDAAITVASNLPKDQAYPLGDDLRRAASAVAHYIYQAHNYYSYEMKIEALHQARTEAEKTQRLLQAASSDKSAAGIAEDYTTLVKQSWGLIKYFKTRQVERAAGAKAKSQPQLASV